MYNKIVPINAKAKLMFFYNIIWCLSIKSRANALKKKLHRACPELDSGS